MSSSSNTGKRASQDSVLAYLRRTGGASRPEVANALGISVNAAGMLLLKLKLRNLAVNAGSLEGGTELSHWVAIEPESLGSQAHLGLDLQQVWR